MTFLRTRRAGLVLSTIVTCTALAAVSLTPASAAPIPFSNAAYRKDVAFAQKQLNAALAGMREGAYPVRTEGSGEWLTGGPEGWTSGFYPGAVWQMYEITGDEAWKQKADAAQASIESQKTNAEDHDVGFRLFTSFGNGYRLTKNEEYKPILMTSAATLASRYNEKVGAIRSWGDADDTSSYQVIMDNMMNLELLFWAAANGGSAEYRTMAISHAKVTQKNLFRPDGSTYHVADFDPASGQVRSQGTHQGAGDDTTWSRGQAWAIYGFTMAYRYTKDPSFLQTAIKATDYYMANLPPDYVPYWDFSKSGDEPRDSSASSLVASALLELVKYDKSATRNQKYMALVKNSLGSMSSSRYLAAGTDNKAILLHGTQNQPSGQVDSGTSFGDYYFVEALSRYAQRNKAPASRTPVSKVKSNARLVLEAPSPRVVVTAGQTARFALQTRNTGGASQPLQITADGLLEGMTVEFVRGKTANTLVAVVSTTTVLPPGSYRIVVQATSGTAKSSKPLTLVVQ